MFDDDRAEQQFYAAWNAIAIPRPVTYSLFTFGESDLDYLLVCAPAAGEETVSIRRGTVKVTRPLVITADNAAPEFQNFFEHDSEQAAAAFLLARSAAFSHLKFSNHAGPARIVSDSVEEAVEKLSRQLDAEEEDRVAILVAPAGLAGLAVLKYATRRVWESASDNIQELRERGFLPD